ncbi:MAG: hypothetical protein HYR49_06165 [Gammaproteobacteria bacterium]|nr:hypothetical protein [Gammaproteobacteria bacterium]
MTVSDARTAEAIAMMQSFAQRTGLDSDRPPRRYLWTDAFAVCNFLGLARATGEQRYTDLALRLVDQVHHVLGRHRADDQRKGWISGLGTDEAEAHPTRGGLRIGKRLPERGEDEPYDERLEWERDGQYFHYLTKWMHALDQVSRSTGDPRFRSWAQELAGSAYVAFTYLPSANHTPRMYWKMSIDLRRPLVPSMGQHDPLGGYITTMQLRTTVDRLPQPPGGPDLGEVGRRYAQMTTGADLASADPLGIGELLVDAYRVVQLIDQGLLSDGDFPEHLLGAALAGLEYYARSGELRTPAEHRLAFRELGLAIGLHAVERMRQPAGQNPIAVRHAVRAELEALMRYVPLGNEIESFWRVPAHQRASTWLEHQDINEVMLATRLAPDGFLVLVLPD